MNNCRMMSSEKNGKIFSRKRKYHPWLSWRTGKKYRYEKGDWEREIQPIVNELCKEYGLSIQDVEIETEEKVPKKWDKPLKEHEFLFFRRLVMIMI